MSKRSSAFLLLSFVVGLSGCWTLPQHFSSAKQAFPDKKSMIPPQENTDAYVTATFQAPYEDVYRAAAVSATQALFNVTEENKREGYILAERMTTMQQGNFTRPIHYYYAITIDELRAKESRVTVAAKAQRECAVYLFFGAGTCSEMAEVHWVDEKLQSFMGNLEPDRTKAEMTQMIIFIRNNLIAAGLH